MNEKIISKEICEKLNNNVFKHFQEICGVFPRGSKKETAMCNFIEDFVNNLNKNGIKVEFHHQSETQEGKPINNIVLKKPATKGYEKAAPVALQAHLDMVCKKTDDSRHNFDREPIKYEINRKNEMTSVNKETTLGADDGIGVACIMAILESTEIEHPEIQAVLTSDEEDGMSGAKWLDKDLVTAKYFINIDAETEGILYYGCAGGVYANISIRTSYIKKPRIMKLYELEISGLQGGHSGLMIDKGRANANRLMGRTLNYLLGEFKGKILLADIKGGDDQTKNAITDKSIAVIAVDDIISRNLNEKIHEIEKIFRYEYNSDNSEEFEPGLSIKVKTCNNEYENVLTSETLDKVVTVLMTVPNGVLDMSTRVHGLVETSSNIGVIALKDFQITITCFIRSSIESKKKFVTEQIRLIAEKIGAGFMADTDFPEWNPNGDSPLLKLFVDTYINIFNDKEVKYESVHAGLECGYFFKKFFDDSTQTSVDLIAIGPTIDDAHRTTETLHLDTTGRVVELLLNVLVKMNNDKIF